MNMQKTQKESISCRARTAAAFLASSIIIFPVIVAAQPETLGGFFEMATGIMVKMGVTLMGMLILLYFIWGVFKYVSAGADAEGRKKGVQVIVHGLLGLFLFVSVWAIVTLLFETFVGGSARTLEPRI